jgi:thioesterase domain-containing protein
VRCHNTWGPTTGKHINNDLDIRHFDIVEEHQLSTIADRLLEQRVRDRVALKLAA